MSGDLYPDPCPFCTSDKINLVVNAEAEALLTLDYKIAPAMFVSQNSLWSAAEFHLICQRCQCRTASFESAHFAIRAWNRRGGVGDTP